MTMHLAGWNFTVHEHESSMQVIDVMIPDFMQAKTSALQQYKPGSAVADFRPLSEEELKGALPVGSFRKWISLNDTGEKIEQPAFADLWPNVEMVNFIPK